MIPAIMLCCDKYHIFAYHTIKTYMKLYPKNNFIFYIPYNEEIFDPLKPFVKEAKVRFIKTGKGFKDTIKGLLEGIGDNDWIYWCSSDQYLDRLDDQEKALAVEKYVSECHDPEIFGITFGYLKKNGRKLLLHPPKSFKTDEGITLKDKYPWNCSKHIVLWHHQYLRSKVIKEIFGAFNEPRVAKDLDKQLYSNRKTIYEHCSKGRYLTIDHNICGFGENSSRGKITRNAVKSFGEYGIELPIQFGVMETEIYWC